jgi:glutathione peroxidase
LTDSNYKELVQIYDEFKDQGLEILAYPCDQFGGQESGNSIQIRKFVGERQVTFPVMSKVEVNGSDADPAFEYLRDNSPLNGRNIMWNFSKFLVNADGDVVASYNPAQSPKSIVDDIKTLL